MFNNICVFGDSLTRGVILNPERLKYVVSGCGFVDLFEKNTGITVSNFSKFGCTVSKGTTIFDKNIKAVSECDCVVLEFGGNDCDFKWSEVSENPSGEHSANTELSVFCSTYKKLIEKVCLMGKKIVVLSLPPIDADKYFRWISRGRNSENIKKWLGSVEYIYRWHEMYNNAVCTLAQKLKVAFVDLRSVFLEKKNYSDYICLDGIHPNEKGHRLIWDTISDAVIV